MRVKVVEWELRKESQLPFNSQRGDRVYKYKLPNSLYIRRFATGCFETPVEVRYQTTISALVSGAPSQADVQLPEEYVERAML